MPVQASNEDWLAERLSSIKAQLELEEFYFLQTCNRLLFLFRCSSPETDITPSLVFELFNTDLETEKRHALAEKASVYKGEEVVEHLLSTASSINSLVVGEREILGQIRKAYDFSKSRGLAGDGIRILMDTTVKTAKQVFTKTRIGDNSVSVVSLAIRQLMSQVKDKAAKILIVGAGQTNTVAVKMLKKYGYQNITIFNRTLENAERLACLVKGNAYTLDSLPTYENDFDVMLSCTGSKDHIITVDLFQKLTNNHTEKNRTLIDLAVPADIDKSVVEKFDVSYLNIEQLRTQAQSNMELRQKEIAVAVGIVEENVVEFRMKFRRRQLEKALSEIPKQVKAVKGRAYDQVFSKEIAALDDSSRETLDKIVNYLEKKYIGIPVSIAKDALEKELKVK